MKPPKACPGPGQTRGSNRLGQQDAQPQPKQPGCGDGCNPAKATAVQKQHRSQLDQNSARSRCEIRRKGRGPCMMGRSSAREASGGSLALGKGWVLEDSTEVGHPPPWMTFVVGTNGQGQVRPERGPPDVVCPVYPPLARVGGGKPPY